MNELLLKPDSHDLLQEARGLKVSDAQTYESAASYGRLFKRAIAFFKDDAKPGIDKASETLDTLRDNLKAKVLPLEESLADLRREMVGYEERQKEHAETRAAELAVDGAPLIISTGVPKTEGSTPAETWSYEVEDLRKLIVAAANGLTIVQDDGAVCRYTVYEEVIRPGEWGDGRPIDWPPVQAMALQPNKGFLHARATSLKAALNYPGVRVFAKKTIRFSE